MDTYGKYWGKNTTCCALGIRASQISLFGKFDLSILSFVITF